MRANSLAVANVLDAMEVVVEDDIGPVTYLPGSVILREGERGSCAYLIESGEARVTKGSGASERDIAVLGPGELIGEMAPIDAQLRSATVTALTQVEVVPITQSHLEGLMEQCDPLLNLMLRAMLSRLRGTPTVMEGAAANPGAPSTNAPAPDERYRRALESASTQLKMEQALSQALKRREFVLYFQPIVSIRDRQIAGFEALIRWMRPDTGMVSPLDFIHAAERTGLIVPIGLWVLEQAGFFQKRLRNAVRAGTGRDRPIFMTANVSAHQLHKAEDVQALCSAIDISGADPSLLKLEITESVLMENADSAMKSLQRLRAKGVGIAIDDFGTGYSSLSYLHQFPVSTLKIDRSFTSSMLASEQSRKLMRSIIGLAEGLDFDVVAEGIEREEELQMLTEMGCGYGQGYLFAKPLPLDEAERLIESTMRR